MVILLILTGLGYYIWTQYKGVYFANKPSGQNIVQLIQNKTQLPLKIPDGYSLSIYASGLNDPRDLTFDPNGNVVVSLTAAGQVDAIVNGEPMKIISGLNEPHGITFSGNKLFVAETNAVSVFDYDGKNLKATNKKKIVDLPGGGEHFTRSILIKDNQIYVSIGSDCNACVESDPKRAAIWVANLDGSNFRLFATGLRNSVFLITNPQTNEIWATDMGRDFLGDNLPPDTINIIKNGENFGWPYCYGKQVIDQEINPVGTKFDCTKTSLPQIEIPAHSAPLGLAFQGKVLFVAYHGSWNRSVPTGYKVVQVDNGVISDFITGWLQPDGSVLGRPVDILIQGTNMYISDDKAGVIYHLKKG